MHSRTGIMQAGGRREGSGSVRRIQGRARYSPGRCVCWLYLNLTTLIMQSVDMFNGEQRTQQRTGLARAARVPCRSNRPAFAKGRLIEAQTSEAEWSQPRPEPGPPPLAGCSGAPDQKVR